jgi:hypothetical protein
MRGSLSEPALGQSPPAAGNDDASTAERGLAHRRAALAALPHLAPWAGIAVSTAGLVLLFVGWRQTARLTNVALQMPYVVSAGLSGLGLVIVGLAIVNVSARRSDAAERSRQLRELRDLLAQLRNGVGP